MNYFTNWTRRSFIIYLTTFILCYRVTAQDTINKVDFYKNIKKYDLSDLWAGPDSFQTIQVIDDTTNNIIGYRTEPLGIIGDSFQRFYIHLISSIKNADDPYKYMIYGKTMVRDHICTFQGTITVRTAVTYYIADQNPKYLQGKVSCDILFDEDNKQSASGYIKGTLTSYFFFDRGNKLKYNELEDYSDGYNNNNQFIGTWTSYKTHITKKCNWGDYRIPESDSLDIGAAEFSANPKFIKYGWYYYAKVTSGEANEIESKKALAIEERKWWK